MNQRIIRFADTKDITQILNVHDQNLLANKIQPKKEILESTGFLVHHFTTNELKICIEDPRNHLVFVMTEDANVIGYQLSYDLKHLNPDWIYSEAISDSTRKLLANEKVLYHRHIAKQLDKQGVGKHLLAALEKEALKRQYEYIVCHIVHKPFRNIPSISLHEQAGYTRRDFLPDDDIDVGIYLKQLIN